MNEFSNMNVYVIWTTFNIIIYLILTRKHYLYFPQHKHLCNMKHKRNIEKQKVQLRRNNETEKKTKKKTIQIKWKSKPAKTRTKKDQSKASQRLRPSQNRCKETLRVCLVARVTSDLLSHSRYLIPARLSWEFVVCLLACASWEKHSFAVCLLDRISWDWPKNYKKQKSPNCYTKAPI
jgi:hypothetical protein